MSCASAAGRRRCSITPRPRSASMAGSWSPARTTRPTTTASSSCFGGKPFYGEAIRALGETALGLGAPQRPRAAGSRSTRSATTMSPGWRATMTASRPLTVAWDPGNGATGEVVQQLTARLPGRHILLNETIDGNFPAHHPDPTVPENLVQLQRGGGARAAATSASPSTATATASASSTREGEIWWGDQLMIVLARDVLARHPGAPILADVKASQVLFDEIARMGGRPVMTATGHSPIKAKLAETGRAARRRDERAHLFRRRLLRVRRRGLCRGAAARHPRRAAARAWPSCATGCRWSSTRPNCAFPCAESAQVRGRARGRASGCAGPRPR